MQSAPPGSSHNSGIIHQHHNTIRNPDRAWNLFRRSSFPIQQISDTKTSGTVGEPSYPPTSSAEYQISDPKSRIQNLGSKTSVTELPNQLG